VVAWPSGSPARQGLHFLRAELPTILAKRTDVLSPRMLHVIEDLAGDWRRLDERIESLSDEIAAEAAKQRLHRNVLAIALANKLARIAWAVLHKGRAFECVKTNATASQAA
jgi:hypothetical protein